MDARGARTAGKADAGGRVHEGKMGSVTILNFSKYRTVNAVLDRKKMLPL